MDICEKPGIYDLKRDILLGEIKYKGILIFKYSDNTWLVNQYIREISRINNLKIEYVDNLESVYQIQNDIFSCPDNVLYVFNCDKIEYISDEYKELRNVIIKTKDISKEIQPSEYIKIIEFPKLLDWQIKDYIKTKVSGLSDDKIDWLFSICKGDINRIDMEVKKLSIFNKTRQDIIFNDLNKDNAYSDLNTLTIFTFTNAILKKDIKGLIGILKEIDNIDVEPTGVVTILYKNFKNIINIQMDATSTPESTGIPIKQFSAIRRNCGVYTNEELINAFNIITNIDYMLKSGYLANEQIVDYLIINIL